MTNAEQNDTATIKHDDTPNEKNIPAEQQQSAAIEMPGAPVGKPPVTLPITGSADNVEELNEADTNTAGDVIDNGNNYTAAENDHNSNATL